MNWYAALAAQEFEKRAPADAKARLQLLLARASSTFRVAFNQAVSNIQDTWTLDYLASLIEHGQTELAVQTAQANARPLSAANSEVYVYAGTGAAASLSEQLRIGLRFDVVNQRAVDALQANGLRLVRNFTNDTRAAVQTVLTSGITDGTNPVETARLVRGIIGLTGSQAQAVVNYRRLLGMRSAEVLTRQLRDRRFDPTVVSAIRRGEGLSSDQINRMVSRYEERYRQFRSETIARTESLRSVHEGQNEMMNQALGTGALDPGDLVQTWVTAHDDRVRDSHDAMDGQEQDWGDPFTSGLGNQLMYPGDPSAPAEDTINCRCVVTTRVRRNTGE